MRIGIIGLPQSGKTTLFSSASGGSAPATPGKTARSIVHVPDPRLEVLAKLADSGRIVHAEVEFLDAGGFSGVAKDAPVELKASAELKQMEALLLVVDDFSGSREPKVDIQRATDEMILNDQAQIEGKIPKLEKTIMSGGAKERAAELEALKKCQAQLESERPLVELDLSEAELKEIRGYTFLSLKPLLIVINIDEDRLSALAEIEQQYADLNVPGRCESVVICGKIETELALMPPDERREFLDDLGIGQPAVDLVIQRAFKLLGLIPFFTAGEMESKAWTINEGTIARRAAGVIHSDIERGFIRAEVIAYEDYVACQTPAEARKQGKMRLEGKEYVVADGDVINFRFNV